MANDKWEIYQDKKGEWRWRRQAVNGRLVGASTEGYARQADCTANAERYGHNGKFNGKGKWEIYQDKKKEWRWRHTDPNGKIVGASSEGYKNRASCLANAQRHGCTDAAA